MSSTPIDGAASDAPTRTLWDDAEEHLELLRRECLAQLEAGMFHVAERRACLDVAMLGPLGGLGGPRGTVQARLNEHPRLLVLAPYGPSAPTVIARAALEAFGTRKLVPFVVPLHLLDDDDAPCLDEDTIARTSPAAGHRVLRRALDEGKALVLVDGISSLPHGSASGPDPEWLAFVESIAAFGEAHPGARVVALLRATPPGSALYPLRLRGFSTAAILPPPAEKVLPAHRFLARRAPQGRAQLYLERVRTLLRGWDADRLQPFAVLGRFDLEGRMKLFEPIAALMHAHRTLDLEHDTLVLFLQRELSTTTAPTAFELEGLANTIMGGEQERGELAPSLVAAVDVVATIREKPGLMVETSTGTLAFADVALQRVLAAASLSRKDRLGFLVGMRGSPWWQEVIALAAELLGSDGALLVAGLLGASRLEDASDTLLAAYCAESVVDLPAALRRRLDERLAKLVPPREDAHMELLLQFGDAFGPSLTRSLATAGPKRRARTALTLGRMLYEPATAALLELIGDERPPHERIECALLLDGQHGVYGEQVAYYALTALFLLALRPNADGAAFEEAIARVDLKTLVYFAHWASGVLSSEKEDDGTLLEREIARIAELGDRMNVVAEGRGSHEIDWMNG